MALNVTEASAVNQLIRFITGDRSATGHEVTRGEALEAANTLARAADKKLMAGYKGDGDVAAIWPDGMQVVIEIPSEERTLETLEEVTRLVGEGYTSGLNPTWTIVHSE